MNQFISAPVKMRSLWYFSGFLFSIQGLTSIALLFYSLEFTRGSEGSVDPLRETIAQNAGCRVGCWKRLSQAQTPDKSCVVLGGGWSVAFREAVPRTNTIRVS